MNQNQPVAVTWLLINQVLYLFLPSLYVTTRPSSKWSSQIKLELPRLSLTEKTDTDGHLKLSKPHRLHILCGLGILKTNRFMIISIISNPSWCTLYAHPPIDMGRKGISWYMYLQSHLQIHLLTPHKSYPKFLNHRTTFENPSLNRLSGPRKRIMLSIVARWLAEIALSQSWRKAQT